ncbi:MAG: hypothetical protein Q9227_005333 [Pyrenula ochraceoflavens]
MVIIKVGPACEIFRVHREVLTNKIPFFNGCLRNPCRESESNVVTLPEDDPVVFNLVIKWTYNSLDLKVSNQGYSENEMECLIKTWVLADKFCVEKLKNDVIKAILIVHRQQAIMPHHVNLVDELAPSLSKLRKFYIDQMAFDLKKGQQQENGITGTLTFDDLGIFLAKARTFLEKGGKVTADVVCAMCPGTMDDPAHAPVCVYHEHEGTEVCPSLRSHYPGKRYSEESYRKAAL